MKKILLILSVFVLISCNSEDANDCFQTTGNTVEQNYQVDDFSKIHVGAGVELHLTQGDENSVQIVSGSNLINDVAVTVTDGKLSIVDHNSCALFRGYAATVAYVTAIDITEIRNASAFDVIGENAFTFSELELISENYYVEDYANVGNFYLTLNNQRLELTFNGVSNCYINGSTTNLIINLYSGDSRFEGEDFIAQNINFYHRGSNDIFVYSVQSLTGQIVSTGNVVAVHTPEEINVEAPYIGQLIIAD